MHGGDATIFPRGRDFGGVWVAVVEGLNAPVGVKWVSKPTADAAKRHRFEYADLLQEVNLFLV